MSPLRSRSLLFPRSAKNSAFASAVAASAFAFCFGSVAWAGKWETHESRLAALDSKIQSAEREIHELVERKAHAHDGAELRATLEEIKAKHKAMTEAAAEREEEMHHMRFSHPEKGDPAKREYVRDRVRSIEELEKDFTLDGRLDRLRAKVEEKFGIPPRAAKSERRPAAAPKAAPADEDAEERVVYRK